jgi:hypothetical protein
MLALHGVWGVAVPDATRVRALGALRAELQMSIADVAATRGKTGPLARGTSVEMMRLKLLPAARGLEADVSEVIP